MTILFMAMIEVQLIIITVLIAYSKADLEDVVRELSAVRRLVAQYRNSAPAVVNGQDCLECGL